MPLLSFRMEELRSHSASNPSLFTPTLFSYSFSYSVLHQSQREGLTHSTALSTWDWEVKTPPVHQQSCIRSNSFPGRHPIALFFLS